MPGPRFLRRRLELRGLRPRSVLILLATWSMSLLVADIGPRLRVRRPIPLVHTLVDCGLGVTAEPQAILRTLPRGTLVRVRNWHAKDRGTCYWVETQAGERGYVPWDATRLDDAGIHVGLRRELFAD